MSNLIRLKNVRVHNLQEIDLDLPKKKLIGFCGPSGSGKSSVAINTLFAEGQRRYLDTFSTSERGLIEQPDKPDADLIEGVPPAIAIARSNETLSPRVTVGSVTELMHFFQLAFSRFGTIYCEQCEIGVKQETPASVVDFVLQELPDHQIMIGFSWSRAADPNGIQSIQDLVTSGFQRAVYDKKFCRIVSLDKRLLELEVLVDRIKVTSETEMRIRESIETAFRFGAENCFVLWPTSNSDGLTASGLPASDGQLEIDGTGYLKRRFSGELRCQKCDREFQALQPNEMSFNSSQGACPACNGLGTTEEFSREKIVPQTHLSMDEGLFSFLDSPPFKNLKTTIVSRLEMDTFAPFEQLDEQLQSQKISELISQLESLLPEATKSLAKELEKLRSQVVCRVCGGRRLSAKVRAYRLGGKGLGEVLCLPICDIKKWCDGHLVSLLGAAPHLMEEILSRLEYLSEVGVGYLSPLRQINQLSTGERQRVSMTNALGSNLVNMLYVFDEPCAGLHPLDVPDLIAALHKLSNRGNTVVAVDHDLDLMLESDFVAEFGPGAGIYGGKITYAGPPQQIIDFEGSLTGDYISGRRGFYSSEEKRKPGRGVIKLVGAQGNNLQDLTVEFPLSLLCVVTGVSGSGKSSLVVDTLFPALCRQKGKLSEPGLPYQDVLGTGAIDDVQLIDQSAIGVSSRSNPATYSKAFDAIRIVFAETLDARARNIKAGRFSFNTDGGRCDACKGEGTKQIDMQFLANLHVKCRFCKGDRYKQEVLNCKYRGQNIADVLNMTVREAFSFFRGKKKVQSKLKPMMDVGLDYLRLGQPASTLSSGESQRLRLAGVLSAGRKARTLFILDEPTVGLHYGDVVRLLDCFDALIAEGHSIIVVEHNQMMMHAADYLIDLGPGPGQAGGQVVAFGSPLEVSKQESSKTGRVIRRRLQSTES